MSGWIDLAKWTCFGLYFVLEDLTIVRAPVSGKNWTALTTEQLHAMGVYLVPWEERVMREANQFWFYALAFSLLEALYALSSRTTSQGRNGKKKRTGRKTEKAVSGAVDSSALVKQIVVDGCDLLIPAELLDWMPTGDLVLGVTMVVSTVLTGREIWRRV